MRFAVAVAISALALSGGVALSEDAPCETEIIQKIEALGGDIERDENRPEKPVVGITFSVTSRFNDKFVYLLKSFPNLKKLDLLYATITDVGVKEIAQLTTLSQLKLSGPGITDASVEDFAYLQNLTKLTLCATRITKDGRDAIGKLSPTIKVQDESVFLEQLKEDYGINIYREPGRGLGVYRLILIDHPVLRPGMANGLVLDQLNVSKNTLTDESLQHLRPLRGWQAFLQIEIEGCKKITDTGIKELGQLPCIWQLSIRNCSLVTGKGLASFKHHPRLSRLSVYQQETWSDADMGEIAEISRLTSLVLDAKNLSDDGFQAISRLQNLSLVDLKEASITSSKITAISALPKLRSLFFHRCSVFTDDAFIDVEELPRLTTLSITDSQITDAGLEHLPNLVNLRQLCLTGCVNISDDGLNQLGKLKSLRTLRITGCRVTEFGRNELQRQLPGLIIPR